MKVSNCNTTKMCFKCKNRKPIEMYDRDAHTSDGFKINCIECNQKSAVQNHKRTISAKLRQQVGFGNINKPSTCSNCGQQKQQDEIHGHHEDYTKPYSVIWLCEKCHAYLHAHGPGGICERLDAKKLSVK